MIRVLLGGVVPDADRAQAAVLLHRVAHEDGDMVDLILRLRAGLGTAGEQPDGTGILCPGGEGYVVDFQPLAAAGFDDRVMIPGVADQTGRGEGIADDAQSVAVDCARFAGIGAVEGPGQAIAASAKVDEHDVRSAGEVDRLLERFGIVGFAVGPGAKPLGQDGPDVRLACNPAFAHKDRPGTCFDLAVDRKRLFFGHREHGTVLESQSNAGGYG